MNRINTCVVASLVLAAAPASAQTVPEIEFDSVADFLKLPPGMNFGEVPSVPARSMRARLTGDVSHSRREIAS